MDDRQLLEAAAKPARIRLRWNALTNDGDAFRLAVKLGIWFGPNLDKTQAIAYGDDGRNFCEPMEGDSYAATRRAIVRAAAALGESPHE